MRIFVGWTEDEEDDSVECPASVDVIKNVIEMNNDDMILHEYCLRLNYTVEYDNVGGSPVIFIPFKAWTDNSVSKVLRYLYENDKLDCRGTGTYGLAFYRNQSIMEGDEEYAEAMEVIQGAAGALKTLLNNAEGNSEE